MADAYVHVTLADERAFSIAVTAVRLAADDGARGANLLRASFTDVARQRCTTLTVGDRHLPAILRARLERELASRPPPVRRALDEMLAADRLPYPDLVADDLDGNRMTVRADGAVELRLVLRDAPIVCELVLVPRGTRYDVEGAIEIDGARVAVARGAAAYFEANVPVHERVVIHLDDGSDLYAPIELLAPLATWTSLYTFHEYAVAWRLEIPATRVTVELRATFPDQELVTVTSADPIWRGRCGVTGTVAGRRVTGIAYVQQLARDATATLSEFLGVIPRETSRVIETQLPLPLTAAHVLPLLGEDVSRYVRDVDVGEFQRILIEPIREIIDRRGKAWRSYTAVVCYHALRGDRTRQDIIDFLLGLAEVIHVGSLIVDDVEDSSPTRRGGPAAHVAHGVPIAINAGTFCYFAWQAWFARLELPTAARLQIYEIYFEHMRVAHLGQALDIQGFTRAMSDEIVASGDVELLERQIKNVYLLKTGAPASVFARIGAIVAGGGAPQVRALAELFEVLGISFQILDDVNNLKGFVEDPKQCEDLTQAKVTMPVLEAMRVLDRPARRDLWDRISRCGRAPELVPSIIETLEQAGAFTACRDKAQALLEEAWRAAAPLLEDSVAKLMLRSFCLHIVETLA